jgi:hypothetical protein
MWRLTIYQKKRESYEREGETVFYDTEDNVSCESDHLDRLIDVIEAIGEVYSTGETRYEIVKVVE